MNNGKKYNWHKIADSLQLIHWQTNNMAIESTAGKKITLAKQNSHIFAFAYKCPHAGGHSG